MQARSGGCCVHTNVRWQLSVDDVVDMLLLLPLLCTQRCKEYKLQDFLVCLPPFTLAILEQWFPSPLYTEFMPCALTRGTYFTIIHNQNILQQFFYRHFILSGRSVTCACESFLPQKYASVFINQTDSFCLCCRRQAIIYSKSYGQARA